MLTISNSYVKELQILCTAFLQPHDSLMLFKTTSLKFDSIIVPMLPVGCVGPT